MSTAAASEPEELAGPKPSLIQQFKEFERPFWMANLMELLERLAYYGVRVVIPIYIASTEDPHGLHFTNTEKGQILMGWAIMQSLLPMFTGGFADHYGYKNTIRVAIALKFIGYLVMATQRSFWPFFLGCLLLACGTAVFKPGVQGTLLRGINKQNSSLGWGVFYQCVNIGGFLGPPLAGYLHKMSWPYVFFSCAGIVSLNYLVLLAYNETPRESSSSDGVVETRKTALQVLMDSVTNMFRPRLLVFLVVMSGFWLMFMQLFDMLPNFIEEWTDSSSLVSALGLSKGIIVAETPRGLQISQEWMINLNAGCIVLLMVFVAALTARVKRLTSIVVGISIAAVGLVLAGFTMSGGLCLLGIFLFSIGEMSASPKMNEYLGVIAPKGQEGLYMGYANVPLAIGWGYGTLKGGEVYDQGADKANLALRYLNSHGVSTAVPEALLQGNAAAVKEKLLAHFNSHHLEAMGAQIAKLDFGDATPSMAVVEKFQRLHAMEQLQAMLHSNATEATKLLWDTYHPYQIWYGFALVGLAAGVGMVVYSRFAKRWGVDA